MVVFYYRMDLPQRFNSIANIICIAPPTWMQVDKPYSIIRAFRKLLMTGFVIILTLRADNEGALESVH
jgi:hypothetical protein